MIAYIRFLLFLVIASVFVIADDDSSDILYPTEGTVWRVGEHVNVTFRESIPPRETVSIFFANARGVTLGGGSLKEHVFPFVVPSEALSKDGGTSLLLAVRRENFHLSSVDSVNVKVVPELSSKYVATYDLVLDLVNLLLDFIQVWIHQILYERELYPAAIFELKKKYNVPVHMATHDQVARYISQFVESLQPLVLKGNCKCVALKIISPTNRLLERFVLEIESALRALDLPLESVLDSEPTCSLADVQQELRACLLRVAATRSSLSSNPPDCTFSLTVETFAGPPAQGAGRGDWIPAESSEEQRWLHLIPLKSIPMDLFKINVFVMEAVKKGKHVSR